MDVTTTAPLVRYQHQIADIQIRRWHATSYAAWFSANVLLIRSRDCIAVARQALDVSWRKHEKWQHQRLMNATVSDDEESEPEWANEDIINGEAALKTAICNKNAAKEAADHEDIVRRHAEHMITVFSKEFPQYQAIIPRKRNRASTEDNTNAPKPTKRARGPFSLPPEYCTTHANNRTASQIFPSWEHIGARIVRWREAYHMAFVDRSTMTSFPQPPMWSCTRVTCNKQFQCDRALESCDCNIGVLFRGMEAKELTKERNEWHPDRFEQCGRVKMEERRLWQKMASEIFIVISNMLDKK